MTTLNNSGLYSEIMRNLVNRTRRCPKVQQLSILRNMDITTVLYGWKFVAHAAGVRLCYRPTVHTMLSQSESNLYMRAVSAIWLSGSHAADADGRTDKWPVAGCWLHMHDDNVHYYATNARISQFPAPASVFIDRSPFQRAGLTLPAATPFIMPLVLHQILVWLATYWSLLMMLRSLER